MQKILAATGAEIIHNDDFVSSTQKKIGKVRADKAAASGDQNTHEVDPRLNKIDASVRKETRSIVPCALGLQREKYLVGSLRINFDDFAVYAVKG